MNRYEIARYAELLPADQRDYFARFALRVPNDRLRGFVRSQLRMRPSGATPRAAPDSRWFL